MYQQHSCREEEYTVRIGENKYKPIGQDLNVLSKKRNGSVSSKKSFPLPLVSFCSQPAISVPSNPGSTVEEILQLGEEPAAADVERIVTGHCTDERVFSLLESTIGADYVLNK